MSGPIHLDDLEWQEWSHSDEIRLRCEACGHEWSRSLLPTCARCGGTDLQTVPLAIVEKGRGTQLSPWCAR